MKPGATILMLAGLALAEAQAGAQPQKLMTDPLFVIFYNPEKVHFDTLPDAVIKKCPDLEGRYKRAWVYGHLNTAQAEYFIVSGFMIYHDGNTGHPYVGPDANGVAVELRGSECIVADTDYLLLGTAAVGDNPFTGLSQSVLEGISKDAIQRHIRAFGGKSNFLEHIKGLDLNTIEPALRHELEILESQPSGGANSTPQDGTAGRPPALRHGLGAGPFGL
jgi:hypothetical protein